MAAGEPIVKARIVFDTKGLSGSMGKGVGVGGIAAGVAGGQAIFTGIKKGIDALVRASPMLQASLTIFSKSMELLLRPIGDTIGMWLRPFLIKFLQFGMTFYKDYASGGFWYAFKEAIAGIFKGGGESGASTGETISDVTKVGGTIVIGAALLGGIFAGGFFKGLAGFLGVGTTEAAGGGLLLPLAVIVGSIFTAEGLFGKENGLVGLIAAAAGLAAMKLAGGGMGIAIPVTLTMLAGAEISNVLTGDPFIGLIAAALGYGVVLAAGGGMAIAIPFALVSAGVASVAVKATQDLTQQENAGQQFPLASKLLGANGSQRKGQEQIMSFASQDLSGGTGTIPFFTDLGNLLDETDDKIKLDLSNTFQGFSDKLIDFQSKNLPELHSELDLTFGDKEGMLMWFNGINSTFDPMQKNFNSTFQDVLVKQNLQPSITETQNLYTELMKLNTTIVTTHVIRTVYEED